MSVQACTDTGAAKAISATSVTTSAAISASRAEQPTRMTVTLRDRSLLSA
jgi:hypothetical protein